MHIYKLGCRPSQVASHHQDFFILGFGDPNKKRFNLLPSYGKSGDKTRNSLREQEH